MNTLPAHPQMHTLPSCFHIVAQSPPMPAKGSLFACIPSHLTLTFVPSPADCHVTARGLPMPGKGSLFASLPSQLTLTILTSQLTLT